MSVPAARRWYAPVQSRRLAVVLALGFASGLPLALTGALLTAVLTDAAIDVRTISKLASVGLPYTLKFLWAPLLDRYRLPFLGRRRGWLVVFQLLLAGAIAALGACDPRANLDRVIALALVVATLSASHDIVIDAYNTELLAPDERAAGSSAYVMGYRIAMLLTGTVALGLGDVLPWSVIYGGLAGVMALCTLATLLADEPPTPTRAPTTLAAAFTRPLVELVTRGGGSLRTGLRPALALLAFIALYKFGDALAGTMTTTFFKRELGFAWSEIAGLSKVLGFAGTLLGATAAGALVPWLGVRRALVTFGLAQALTNLLFALLALHGRSYPLLGLALFVDSTANALGTGAFVAYLMSQTQRSFAASQYALFTGLSSVGARVFGWLAGPLVVTLGYAGFFAVTAALALPGLVLVLAVPRHEASA